MRRGAAIREMVQEVRLHPSDFIAPLFIQEGTAVPTPIASMPGVFRLNLNDLVREARELFELGIRGVALFPVTPSELKTPDGREALNPECLVLRAVRTTCRINFASAGGASSNLT